jgi:hypothetical protein
MHGIAYVRGEKNHPEHSLRMQLDPSHGFPSQSYHVVSISLTFPPLKNRSVAENSNENEA